jgi:diguanylate cyclase (GGDEF)-like protein
MQWSDDYRDKLTGFWRRDVLFEYLNQKIREKAPLKRPHKQFSIVLVDLDHFKMLNDRYGHLFGDKVIRLVATKVKEACDKRYPHRSFLVRYGGDEMVVILDKIGLNEARKFATSVLNNITNNPFFAQIEEQDITASAGIAVYPDDSADSKELFEKADQALYLSKKFRSNKVISVRQAAYVGFTQHLKTLASFIFFLAFIGFICYLAYAIFFFKGLSKGSVELQLNYGGTIQGKIIYQDTKKIVLEVEDGSQITILKKKIKLLKPLEQKEGTAQ